MFRGGAGAMVVGERLTPDQARGRFGIGNHPPTCERSGGT